MFHKTKVHYRQDYQQLEYIDVYIVNILYKLNVKSNGNAMLFINI